MLGMYYYIVICQEFKVLAKALKKNTLSLSLLITSMVNNSRRTLSYIIKQARSHQLHIFIYKKLCIYNAVNAKSVLT